MRRDAPRHAEGTEAAARNQSRPELQIAGHLVAESAEHRPGQPGRAAESERAAPGSPTQHAAAVDAARQCAGQSPNFICFEPMAGITNALNLAHKGVYKELQYDQARRHVAGKLLDQTVRLLGDADENGISD